MKKSLLIVVIALALALAFGATPAFAKYAGWDATRYSVYATWAQAASWASTNPDAAVQGTSPHAGYATTTIKCIVCHSVHRGSNTILGKGQNTCVYCHTSATCGGGATAGSQMSISWYPSATSNGPHSSCASSFCHAGAHGIGASTYGGPRTKLLVAAADSELASITAENGFALSTLNTWTGNANTRALGTAAVCGRSGCHDDSMFGVITAGASKTLTLPTAEKTVTGHRVVAGATSTWNDAGQFSPYAAFTGTIAWAGVDYCNSCHDLKDTSCNASKPAFPHAINGVVDNTAGFDGTWRAAVWLTAGPYAGGTRAAVGESTQFMYTARVAAGVGQTATQLGISSSAGSPVLDGICLKCHREGSGGNVTSGVGASF